MADKRANLILTLKDEASAGISKIKAGMVAAGAAVAGVTAFMVDSIKSYMESEKAVNRLNLALKNQGIYSEQLSKEMQEYASELQKTTTFSDEAVLSTQTMLTTFGLAGQEMKKATQSALDLSTGLGIDLNTATMLIGKAFNGSSEALGRYGIKIDESLPKTKQFSAVLAQVQNKFGGSAQAEVETMAGKIANLTNRWDDIKETIGGAVVPILQKIIGWFEPAISHIEQFGGIFEAVFVDVLTILLGVVEAFQRFTDSFPFLAEGLNLIGVNLDAVTQAIQRQIDGFLYAENEEKASNQRRLINTNITTAQAKALKDKQAAEDKAREAKRMAEIIKQGEEETELYQKLAQERLDAEKKKAAGEERLRTENAAHVTRWLNHVSSLQTAKNKEMAALGKASALALATVDTYAAANGAYKAMAGIPVVGPALGAAAAAAAIVAGLHNVSRISGIQLAEGGIVMPRMGGTLATIGEGGRSEAVIPLGDARTNEKLQEAGLGSSVTININADVIVGSNESMKDLARMIDQELFSLRRNRESVAFEGI